MSITLAAAGCDIDIGDLHLRFGPQKGGFLTPDKPKSSDDEGTTQVDDDEDPNRKALAPKPGSKPATPRGTVDLGVAVFPNGTPEKGAASYLFNVPPQHKVGFHLDDDERGSVEKDYHAWAKKVGFKQTNAKSFSWVPPSGCPSGFQCIFQELIKRNKPDLIPLVKRFRAQFEKQNADSLTAAKTLLAFVQSVPYALVEDEPFGLRPAPIVLAAKKGDCDSKALLLFILLGEFEIPSVIVSSDAHNHTMVGIALPSSGSSFRYQGRSYAFAETTAVGAPLGWLAPDLKSPNDWRVDISQ